MISSDEFGLDMTPPLEIIGSISMCSLKIKLFYVPSYALIFVVLISELMELVKSS